MSSKLLPAALVATMFIAVAFAACDEAPAEPTPAKTAAPASTPATPATAIPTTPPAAALMALRWTKPDAWEKVDHQSRMRKATFRIPKAEGDSKDAEMSVTQVGGTVAANIQRWEGQFAEDGAGETEEKTVNGLTVTIYEKSGTFRGMTQEGTKDWALLGAVVHTKPAHYFKMTGPLKTVKASRADFDKLVASFTMGK